ncbi:Obp56b [Drosophila busckii]|uniref:Obp56b n=1 Tax=Drosophila busckii TaxID=30019 RepID=A0A0M4EIT2_DROBS|nr:uncharacterized protein LOC108594965 [Drosophila busckii]ALC42760.1 Obp56b [Drosophila busckii]
MKVQVFLLLLVLGVSMAQTPAELAAYKEKQQACVKELKISDAEAAQLTTDKEVPSPTAAGKCYYNCLYKQLGLVGADDKPNNQAIMKYTQARFSKAPMDKIKAELAACAVGNAKFENKCEFMHGFEQCMSKALKA